MKNFVVVEHRTKSDNKSELVAFEKKVDAVFAYGNLSKHAIRAMNGANSFHQFYSDKKLLIADLKKYLQDGDVIYIKGSRGMKMEDIITGIKS